MRCPKCHYLSFEPEARCKNCGYSFSLADPDLALKGRRPADEGPLADFMLRTPDAAPPPRPSRSASVLAAAGALAEAPPRAPASIIKDTKDPRNRSIDAPADRPERSRPLESPRSVPHPTPPPAPKSVVPPTTELPLFVKGMPAADAEPARESPFVPPEFPAVSDRHERTESDEPLVKVPSEPRTPLSVRRGQADTGAHRAMPPSSRTLGPLDRDLLEDLRRIEAPRRAESPAAAASSEPGDPAGAGQRLGAAVVDASLLAGLAAAVSGITLRWCDVPLDRALTLPVAPIAAFILLVSIGYLLMFTTAGGQTVGKMLFGIRVVDDDVDAVPGRLAAKHAVYRVMFSVPSVLALGAGFLPALVGNRRAIHDRLAHTRVVRA